MGSLGRRALIVLFAAATWILGPLAVGAQAGFTTEELTLDGVPGPNPALLTDSRHCTGAAGECELSATLFLPDPLPASPVPAILSQHGFPGSRASAYVRDAAEFLADQGYVVLTWDARGFGTSQGYVMLDSPDYEAEDISLLIDFLATRPEVKLDGPGDPRVGMYGQSYGGAIQVLAAAKDSRIDTLVMRETWHDLPQALAPGDIIKYQWISLLFIGGTAATEGNLAPDLAGWFAEVNATNTVPDHVVEELDKRSPFTYAGLVDIPTFVLQGQQDTLFNILEGSRLVDMIATTGAPTKLFWYWGGHGGYPNYPDGTSRTYVTDDPMEGRQLDWLNRHLKGDGSIDTGPRFEYLRADGSIGSNSSVPPVATVSLDHDVDGLTLIKPAGRSCPQFGAPSCSYTELSNFSSGSGPGNVDPYDAPGTALAMDTEPLSEAIEVVGNPAVKFEVDTATGEPVSLFFKFFEISADGSSTLIKRLVTPIRATPGQAIDLDLAGFAHTFEAGSSIRLVAATTDAAYYGTDPADEVTMQGSVQLSLPVLSQTVTPPQPGPVGLLAETGASPGLQIAGITLLALALMMAVARRLVAPQRS